MKIFYVSDESGETEYVFIASDRSEVEEQLEGGEKIDGEADIVGNVSGWPTERRLVSE